MVDKAIPQQRAQSFIDLIYETADGYISVAVQQDKEWLALTRALNKPEWLEDDRFKTATGRHRNINARLELTQEALRTKTAAQWLEILEAEGVPCAPVLTRSAMIEHPQIVANGIIFEHEHDVAGNLRQARPPARFSKTDFELRQPGAMLGEHTEEVFLEAGFTDAEIADLRAAGVLGATQQQAAE